MFRRNSYLIQTVLYLFAVLNVNLRDTNVILGDAYRTLWGRDWLEEELCGLTFRLSVPSFFQINRDQTERLYQLALEFAGLTGEETVLDLYGAGSGAGRQGIPPVRESRPLRPAAPSSGTAGSRRSWAARRTPCRCWTSCFPSQSRTSWAGRRCASWACSRNRPRRRTGRRGREGRGPGSGPRY